MSTVIKLWFWVGKDFWKKLAGLSTPIMLHALTFAGFGLADAFMVAQISESAVAAAGLAGRVMFFNTMIILGASAGASVFSAQLFGAGKIQHVWLPLTQSVAVSALLTLPFILLYTFAPSVVMSIASQESVFIDEASLYLQIVGWTLIGTVFVVPIEATLRSLEKTKVILVISAVSVGINLVLNYALIFGHWGFPEMGLAGAAWGTAISRILQTLWLLIHVIRFDQYLLPKFAFLSQLCDRRQWQSFFNIAVPQMIQQCAWAGGALTYGFIMARMGVDVLAIVSIVFPIETVLLSLFIGLHMSSATMLGQLLGARQKKLAWLQSHVLLSFSTFCGIVLCFILWSGIIDFNHLFQYLNISEVSSAKKAVLVMACGLVLKAYNHVAMDGVLRSGGDVRFTMVSSFIALWLVGIPLAFLGAMVFNLPLHWVMILILLEDAVKAISSTIRLQKRKWVNSLSFAH